MVAAIVLTLYAVAALGLLLLVLILRNKRKQMQLQWIEMYSNATPEQRRLMDYIQTLSNNEIATLHAHLKQEGYGE